MTSTSVLAPLVVMIDGQVKPPEEATISVTDPGLLRGDGVFEVVRVYLGRPFALDEHLDRMARSAAGLRLDLDIDAVRGDVSTLLPKGQHQDALLRLVVTRGGRRIAMLEAVPVYPAAVALATFEHEPNPLTVGLKTLSYAGNELASRLAQELGADQALLVSPAGQILEGPNFALFVGFGSDEPLVTPPLATGILDSITRRRILKVAHAEERSIRIEELGEAHEAFIASTVREVLPVTQIDLQPLRDAPGPRTVAAAANFQASVRTELHLAE